MVSGFPIVTICPPALVSASIRRFRQSAIIVLAIVIAGFSGVSCAQIRRASVPVTPISSLLEVEDAENEIYVRGTVINRVAILGQGLYQVEDDTGSVWVLTEDEVPAIDTNVTVRGISEGLMQIGDRRFGVTLKEIERL